MKAQNIYSATIQDLLDARVITKAWVEEKHGQIVGQVNFRRANEVLERANPWWYLGRRPATEDEDRKEGIDLWVKHALNGWTPIQIKSSQRGVRDHLRKQRKAPNGRRLAVVMVNDTLSDAEVVGAFEKAFVLDRRRGDFGFRKRALRARLNSQK